MKLFNLSYNNKERFREVQSIVGNSYSLIQSILRGGNGSVKGYLMDAPAEISRHLEQVPYQRSCNIEERRNGLIIHFRSRLESFAIPLSFSELRKVDIVFSDIPEYERILVISTEEQETVRIGYRKFEVKGIEKFIRKLNISVKTQCT